MLVPILLFCFGLFVFSLLWGREPSKSQITPKLFRDPLPKPLIAAYGLYSIAYIPATVYLSDYVTNELGLDVGNKLWQLFGVGALFGPWLANLLLKRIGSPMALSIAYVCQNLAFCFFAFSRQIVFLAIGSVVTGVCVPGIVLLTAAELHRTLKANYFSSAWSLATLVFACAQAVSALAMALLFQVIQTYQPLFMTGALLLVPACLLTLKECVTR